MHQKLKSKINNENFNFYTVRFSYQGVKDRNYASIYELIKIFIFSEDELIVSDLSVMNLLEIFILCILRPK